MEISSVNSGNFTGSENKKTQGSRLKGFSAGWITARATTLAGKPIGKKLLGLMEKFNCLTPDEFTAVSTATEKALGTSGLNSTGMQIIRATEGNLDQIKGFINKSLDSNFIAKSLPQQVKEVVSNIFTNMFHRGNNAAFIPAVNKIVMPETKLALAAFHEMGHAMNHHFSKIGKFLQKSRALTVLAAPIALIALLKNKKADDEKPKGFWDKTTTFIKENAGKLTFLTFVPILIEEAMASLKGQQLAKTLLSPELAKKVAKANIAAWATYMLGATLAGVGIYLGTKVRDKIVHKQNA